MKAPREIFIFILLISISCAEDKVEIGGCEEALISETHNFYSLIESLPDQVVVGLAKNPDAAGALGRNKDGYFHVRFQLDIGFLASYATHFRSEEALEKFILSAEYSFDRQKPAGDFELVVPTNLQYLGPPSTGDISSGVSFFLSALGSSLVLLDQSEWFSDRPNDELKQRLARLSTKFQSALNYLKTQKEVLRNYDADAPNRLLFDALAFYSMGLYLNDSEAKAIGLEFIEWALAKQDPAGFFPEGAGFDSSYNGVSIRLGIVLLGILPAQEAIRERLKKSIGCSVQWQASRVLDNGEITLQGNTRVYPGGETFLGSEKQVAWIDSLLAFYFTHTLSEDTYYQTLAKKLETFYN